ncbi:MAG: hypothetical protein ACLQRM_12785 [Acidimicrobiales bacterium]
MTSRSVLGRSAFPILMPSERAGTLDGPVLSYLLALEAFDAKFPGFAHDIHGVEHDEHRIFSIECLNDEASDSPLSSGGNG